MKKSLITFAISLAAIAPSFAQSTASGIELKKNSIHVDYVNTKLVNTDDYYILNGFNIGYNRINELGSTPLMYEYGAAFGTAFYDEDFDDVRVKKAFVDFRVPLSLSFNYDIPGTSVGIMPVAGIDLGVYLHGEAGREEKSRRSYTDIFGPNEHTARFIFDFHAGTRILIKNVFFLEYIYEGPFAELYAYNGEHSTVRRHNFGVGIFF